MQNKPVIGIVGGTGKMGTFFRNIFEKENLKVFAAGRKTIFSVLVSQCDIVIVSVPISDTPKVIEQIIPYLKKDALLCDLTSLKMDSMKAMARRNGPYLGIHPLFSQLVNDLRNQIIVFCPGKTNHWVKFVKNIFEGQGAKIINLEPAEHDKQMALLQALTHFTNISLGLTLTKSKTKLSQGISTPLYKLQSLILGRIFANSPRLYRDILMENPAVPTVLLQIRDNIDDLYKDILNKDDKNFDKKFVSVQKSLDQFTKVAQRKTTEILNLVDAAPSQTQVKNISVSVSKLSVAYLGPESTYSHIAATKVFPKTQKLIPTKTIGEVFEMVQKGTVDFGIVPSENSIEGTVKQTIDNLIDYPLEILADFTLPINHFLLSYEKNIRKIKIVRSHPQALGQCRNFLKTHLPNAKIEEVSSTVSAINKDGSNIAFIASSEAAKKYNLNILSKNIGDVPNNQTQFYIISRGKSSMFSQPKTKAILLLAIYDRVGSIRDVLNVFADNNLNLGSVNSTPSGNRPWEYLFLVDVHIKNQGKSFNKALLELQQFTTMIRILGEV